MPDNYRLSEIAKHRWSTSPSEFHIVSRLSPKESEVFTSLGTGRSVLQIATDLDLTPATVGAHVRIIKAKLGLPRERIYHLATRYAMFREITGLTPRVKENQIIFS